MSLEKIDFNVMMYMILLIAGAMLAGCCMNRYTSHEVDEMKLSEFKDMAGMEYKDLKEYLSWRIEMLEGYVKEEHDKHKSKYE